MEIVNPIEFCGDHNEFMIGEHFEPVPLNICKGCKKERAPHNEEYNDPLGFGCFIRYAYDTGYCQECATFHRKNDTGELFTRFVKYARDEPIKVIDAGGEQKAYYENGTSLIFQKSPENKNKQIARRLQND